MTNSQQAILAELMGVYAIERGEKCFRATVEYIDSLLAAEREARGSRREAMTPEQQLALVKAAGYPARPWELRDHVEALLAAEREKCAKVCEARGNKQCAAAIRALKD